MIRFIKIGDQICEDENHFAYWNTITDKFLHFDGECVFDSWEEFIHYYEHDTNVEKYGLQRLMGVTPDEFIDTKSLIPLSPPPSKEGGTLMDKLNNIDTKGKSVLELCKEVNDALCPMDRIPTHKNGVQE